MEKLIDQIYSEFDASITITPAKGKSFSEKEINCSLTSIKDKTYQKVRRAHCTEYDVHTRSRKLSYQKDKRQVICCR